MNDATQTAILAGFAGALAACASGRARTRLDNLIIGGTFTAFAAYRDPRRSAGGTLLVAIGEGLLWGVTDRLSPKLKELIMPGGSPATA